MSSQSSLARDKPDFFDIGLAGRYYNTGRGPLSVPSGQNLRLLGVNPAGSGKLVIVHRIRFFTNTPLEFLDLRVNPTTGLPTFALTSTSQRLGSPNGSAVVTCDVSGTPLGGGVLAPYQIPMVIGTLTEFHIDPGRIIPPGFSIGLNFNNASGGASTAYIILDWVEEPLDV